VEFELVAVDKSKTVVEVVKGNRDHRAWMFYGRIAAALGASSPLTFPLVFQPKNLLNHRSPTVGIVLPRLCVPSWR
jgi:hypothetical protein